MTKHKRLAQGFTPLYMCSLSSVTVTHAIRCHAVPVKNNHVYILYSTQLHSQRKPNLRSGSIFVSLCECMRTTKIGPDLRSIETKVHNIAPRHFEEQLYIINILTRCFYTLQKSKAGHLFFKF